jgi:uncharacterized protein YgiM (DUF1202 family)
MWRKFMIIAALWLVVGIAAVQPAMAQNTTWHADFYNNTFLLGKAAATRTDGVIAFDWGNAQPNGGVNADNFSARWGADPYFTAGTYRFYALVDDNVKVTVDFSYTPLIDTFSKPAIGQIVSGDVTLGEGFHHVQVDYREVSGSAYVYVTWENLASNPTGPNFPVPQQSYSTVNNGGWTAQYYSNSGLSGNPVLTRGETFPNYNWGTGSPDSSVPSDNFSARWTSVQTIDAASYTITVKADDGVRVTVDGVTYINEWHLANNNTHTATFNLTGGPHNFMIEYYEAGGNAFIDYRLARTGVNPPVPANPNVNTGTTATVTTGRLNVRNAPNTGGTILVKINQGETYPVAGANADKTWWQINVNGTVGWVFGRYVSIGGNSNVPVTNSTAAFAAPASTGYTVTALDAVNIRNAPSTRGSTVLSKLPIRGLAQVVGRNANSSWWQVDYQGVVGWVSARYAQLQPGVSLANIPVTG